MSEQETGGANRGRRRPRGDDEPDRRSSGGEGARPSGSGGDRPGATPERAADRPSGPAAAGDPGHAEAARPRTPLTQQIGRIVILVLLVLFGVFAAANAQRVDFSWVFGDTEVVVGPTGEIEGGVPLIVLLLTSLLVGAVTGGLAAWQSARSRRRGERAEDTKGRGRRGRRDGG